MRRQSAFHTRLGAAACFALLAAAVFSFLAAPAKAQEIKIGFSMALTGPLSPNGKQALLGMKIWEEEINSKGGLLGRPVKLVYYDDQTNASTVPGIYTKLIDVDKVDLVLGPYATNMAAPAMPVIMQKGKLFIILFGLDVNHEFKYNKFFAMIPTGPNTKASFTEGFFDTAAAQNPKPTTAALVAADAEFSRNVCSYPLDSVGMVKAVNELGFKPKMIGGAMVGLQATVFKNQLGPLLNGFVNYETWVPSKAMTHEGTEAFFKKYQERAKAEGVDPLGYYLGGWGYAYIQVLGDAVKGANSLKDDVLADYIRKTTFNTIHGPIKFGANGEWEKGRMLQVQYHGIKQGDGVDVFRGMSYQNVLTPADLKTGNVVYPYEKAK
jgi:branched-chain amino acid transport system substrate-binding protein